MRSHSGSSDSDEVYAYEWSTAVSDQEAVRELRLLLRRTVIVREQTKNIEYSRQDHRKRWGLPSSDDIHLRELLREILESLDAIAERTRRALLLLGDTPPPVAPLTERPARPPPRPGGPDLRRRKDLRH